MLMQLSWPTYKYPKLLMASYAAVCMWYIYFQYFPFSASKNQPFTSLLTQHSSVVSLGSIGAVLEPHFSGHSQILRSCLDNLIIPVSSISNYTPANIPLYSMITHWHPQYVGFIHYFCQVDRKQCPITSQWCFHFWNPTNWCTDSS